VACMVAYAVCIACGLPLVCRVLEASRRDKKRWERAFVGRTSVGWESESVLSRGVAHWVPG
jgi:hypothetical protein